MKMKMAKMKNVMKAAHVSVAGSAWRSSMAAAKRRSGILSNQQLINGVIWRHGEAGVAKSAAVIHRRISGGSMAYLRQKHQRGVMAAG